MYPNQKLLIVASNLLSVFSVIVILVIKPWHKCTVFTGKLCIINSDHLKGASTGSAGDNPGLCEDLV